MTMREFIKQNRSKIDRGIRARAPGFKDCPFKFDDKERRYWVLADGKLRGLARINGIKINRKDY